jgi:hypothetical protein
LAIIHLLIVEKDSKSAKIGMCGGRGLIGKT